MPMWGRLRRAPAQQIQFSRCPDYFLRKATAPLIDAMPPVLQQAPDWARPRREAACPAASLRLRIPQARAPAALRLESDRSRPGVRRAIVRKGVESKGPASAPRASPEPGKAARGLSR